jgi:hypothetical protein
MDVPRPGDEPLRHRVHVERADRAHRGQHRPVAAAREDHGRPGRLGRIDDARRDVDAPSGHRVEHEPAEGVVADDADERHSQPEARGATREDRRRAADGHRHRAHGPLDLAEPGHRVGIGDHDVGVDLADDEDVDVTVVRIAHPVSPA